VWILVCAAVIFALGHYLACQARRKLRGYRAVGGVFWFMLMGGSDGRGGSFLGRHCCAFLQ